MPKDQPTIETSPMVSDEIRKTTCYMCACRCGINVHMKKGADGKKQVAYIEGNKDHPVNQGVLCAKGSAGIMQVNAPSRLKAPLKRVGPRGSGEFEEISWDEALTIATDWLKPVREKHPEKLAFFTGRDQSQSFTSLWAQGFGTPNYAAHGGFCSVNMAAAGIYTMGGAGIGKIKARGARVVGVNPIRSGYNAVADDWFGITPGTDGLLIMSLIHELFKAGKLDLEYLGRFTNASCLVNEDPNSPDHGLLLRDGDGQPLVIDRNTGDLAPWNGQGVEPDLRATHRHAGVTHRPVFHLMADRFLDVQYAPENVAAQTGIEASRIKRLAADMARVAFDEAIELDRPWTDFRGKTHAKMVGRPVSMHSMRGISAHSNGFQTCRALHTLQIILGAVETPGGMRFKPPYPKPATAHPKPHGKVTPGEALNGPHLGFTHGPDDLLLHEDGSAIRIDKAFTWENPLSSHGMMHMVIANAHAGDPYKIDTLFMYMANMSWNSSMNTTAVMDMLTDKDEETGEYVIPRIIYSDAYSSEMVAFADLILPDTTYLERHDCISLLDRPICEADAVADAIRWPVVEPDRDVRGFQSVLCELGARLNLPGFVNEDGTQKYEDYADYITNHMRRPGVGPLAGWRMGETGLTEGRGQPNEAQLDAYIKNGGFWMSHVPEEAAYYKPFNMAYQDWAVKMSFYDSPQPYIFTPYVEPLRRMQLAAEGHGAVQPPDHLRTRIKDTMDPLPIWYAPLSEELTDTSEYDVHALTQRPMAMYHSWGTQNAWLRQIHGVNPLYVPTKIWDKHGFSEGDWAKVSSPTGVITVPVAHMAALNENTVWTWNAIGKRKGAWALDNDAPETTKGFLLNHLIHELLPEQNDGMRWSNSDPITGQAAWFDLRVKIEKTAAPEGQQSQPAAPAQKAPVPKGPKDLTWKVGK